MPTITATSSTVSITLSDGAPFSILQAIGMGGADVRRVTVQGPAQDGDSDTGYRLAPREIELVIGFHGTTDTILDGYRDTLTSFFKPLTATPVKLRVTRDDGEIRQIDCNVVGSVKIDLLAMHRPGHYHRATVRLRAADPAWYKLAPGTASFTGSVSFDANWWLAGGAIDSGQLVTRWGTPATNDTIAYSGTIGSASSFTIATRAAYVSPAGTESYMFEQTQSNNNLRAAFGVSGTVYGTSYALSQINSTNYPVGTTQMSAGTQVYFFNSHPRGITYGGINYTSYKTAWQAPSGISGFGLSSELQGTAFKWRTRGWSGAVQLYAIYSPSLSEGQRTALQTYMNGTAGTAATTVAIAYNGDLPEYPVISLTGPITGPSILNTATGELLDFGTVVIGSASTYVIDTRYGYKTVTQGTVSKVGELSDASDLSTWHIAPSPVATGGTNVVTINGTGIGVTTRIQIVYYHRYMSY